MMMDKGTNEKVLNILNKVTGKRINHIELETDLKSQLSLDSIQIVELFAALEKELNIELPLQLMTVRTGKDFLELLERQLKN